MRRFVRLVPIIGALLAVGLVGCSGSMQFSHSSPKEAYNKGMEQYKKENYDRALRYFRAVFNYGRGNEWAPDAQFQLALAQRERGKHLVAANEFERFRQLYRNDPRVPRAEYEQAYSYYLRSPRYELDQTHTREALSLFQLFLDRNPNHELAPDAEEKVEELREKLAHKKYDAAAHYEKRDMWPAATVTFEDTFDQYPDTDWADDALFGAVRSYVQYADQSILSKQAERYQKALDHFARLEQLFPDSPHLEEARSLKEEAENKLQQVRQREQETQSLARGGSGDENE